VSNNSYSMSEQKPKKATKVPKVPKVAEEKPKRQRKARAKPTKQELIKFFQDSMNELKQIVSELNEEEVNQRTATQTITSFDQ